MTEEVEAGEAQTPEPTFSQADVDRIVKDRLAQQAKNRFGDYEELRSKAEGAKTLEQRLAEMEKTTADALAKSLRSDIAARYGIPVEDRDLFLTGGDEETLIAQAERLAARSAEQKKLGGTAPAEGSPTKQGSGTEAETRAFARKLFSGSD